ncbi:MAG: hypothetical protein QOJ65_2387, partial [Fimbriimonadaceae bacterium]|nr:hypothetical protein [Fimbriimonadaceae bacterium]
LFRDRVRNYRESIDALVKLNQENGPFDQASADKLVLEAIELEKISERGGANPDVSKRRFLLESRLPSMRFALRVLAKMDPDALAALPDTGRVVFATDPNAAQQRLDLSDTSWLDELYEGRKMLAKAYAQSAKNDKSTTNMPYYIQADATAAETKAAKLLCVLQRLPGSQQLQMNFSLYDEKGDVMLGDYETLGRTYLANFEVRQKAATLRQQSIKEGFEVGPIMKELTPRYASQGGELRPISQQALEALLSPTTHDPLSFTAGDIVVTGSQRAGLNAVALLPDGVGWIALSTARLGKVTLDAFTSALTRTGDMDCETKDGWLVMRPQDPTSAMRTRLSRPVLGAYVKKVAGKKAVALEDIADLRRVSEMDVNTAFADLGAMCVTERAGSNTVYSDPDVLGLYALLSDEQREAAKNGGITVRIDELDAAGREALNRFIYNGYRTVQLPGAKGNEMYGGDSLETERTQVLPEGPPMNTVIEFTDKDDDAVFTKYGPESGSYEYGQSLDAVAGMLAFQVHPEMGGVSSFMGISGLKLGRQREITIRVKVPEKCVIMDHLQENHSPHGPAIPVDKFVTSLPQPVREKLEQRIAQIFREWASRSGGHFVNQPAQPASGGTAPPARR